MSDTTRICAAPYSGSQTVLGHTVYLWSYNLPNNRVGWTYSVNVNSQRLTANEVYSTMGQALTAAATRLSNC